MELIAASEVSLPQPVDSNSPAFWAQGEMHVIVSSGHPFLSVGANLRKLDEPVATVFDKPVDGRRWMEAVVPAPDGQLYGYYHLEPAIVCANNFKTAPAIGAARSSDGGWTWIDLGIVLSAPVDSEDCESSNHYFVGGHGDFSVALDPADGGLYFLFSSYVAPLPQQGVALARLAWQERDSPRGRVFKWRNGRFDSPGLGGPVTPVYSAHVSWHRPSADSLWGPSVHWNTHLEQYVILMNRAVDSSERWRPEGVYVAYTPRLGDPATWSEPTRLLAGGSWYPQVMGLEPGAGTDKLAGALARLFLGGVSRHLVRFERP